MGITVGGGLAYLVGGSVVELVSVADAVSLPLIGQVQPWQVVFFIVGLPGLLLVPLVAFMTEPKRHGRLQEAGGAERETVPFTEVLHFVTSNRAIFLPLFSGASLLSVIGYGTLNWYPTFLIRTYGMNVGDIGLQFGLIYMVFGTLGAFGSAILSERLAQRGYSDANLRVVMLVGLALIVPAGLGPLMPTKYMALCCAAPTVMLLNAHLGVTVAALQQITPNQMRATVSAMMLFTTNILGLGLGAVVIASFTDFVFADDAALRYSLAIVAGIVCPLAALCLRFTLLPFRTRLVRN
jgi:MFS family permease